MADEPLETTINGLWRTLVRLVPARKRPEAWALANTLEYFAELRRRTAHDAGYEAGRAFEQQSSRADAARLAQMPCPSDARPTWKDELRSLPIFDKPDTPH